MTRGGRRGNLFAPNSEPLGLSRAFSVLRISYSSRSSAITSLATTSQFLRSVAPSLGQLPARAHAWLWPPRGLPRSPESSVAPAGGRRAGAAIAARQDGVQARQSCHSVFVQRDELYLEYALLERHEDLDVAHGNHRVRQGEFGAWVAHFKVPQERDEAADTHLADLAQSLSILTLL